MLQSKLNGMRYPQTNSSENLSHTLKKSIGKVKETSYDDFYRKRLSKISEIFQFKGYDLTSVLSQDELMELMDTIGKEPFDRDISGQLFEQVPISNDLPTSNQPLYTINDFADTHIKAEYLMILQAEETESELNKVYQQIDRVKGELHAIHNDPKPEEGYNSLLVDILEAGCDDENYRPENGQTFSVLVIYDYYKYETDEVPAKDSELNLKFHRTLHLKVKSPQETIRILLRDFKKYRGDQNYKDLKCTLTLDRFEDQLYHDEWFYLYDQNNQITNFRVRAAIQWQYRDAATYEEALRVLVELEEKLNENKETIEACLRALVRPFANASVAMKKKTSNSRNVKN